MKKVTFLVLMVACSLSLSAQQNSWRISKIGATFGWEQDMPFQLSSESMLRSAVNGDQSPILDAGLTESDVTDMFCENFHHRLELSLQGPGMTNSELRVGLIGIFNRGESITYDTRNTDFHYVSMDSWTNELALETTFLKYSQPVNWFRLYGGVGTNLGVSFDGGMNVRYRRYNPQTTEEIIHNEIGNEVVINQSDYEYGGGWYELKNGLHHRAFVQAGVAFRILRVEIVPEFRYGLGFRKFSGASMQWTQTRSYNLAVRVALGKYDWKRSKKSINELNGAPSTMPYRN